MKTSNEHLVLTTDQANLKEIAGLKFDVVQDEAEDLVLDLVDAVAEGGDQETQAIVTELARRAETQSGFREAALGVMNYLLGAYSNPDYRFRPDLNRAVGLQHVNTADEMLRKAVA